MAETLTANYSWTKPDPGASANTWGATLNSDLDKIDAQVFGNQQTATQAGVPVGAGALWFTGAPPTNWLICDGSSLDTTTYAALFAVIGYTFGGSGSNFNLPTFVGRFPMGASVGSTGGEASHVLTPAEMPIHTHGVSDPTHTHGVVDPTHVHGQSPHAHAASQDPHTHTYAEPVTGQPGFTQGGALGGIATGTTSAAQPAVSVAAATVPLNAAATGIAIGAAATGISIQAAGGGAAHNNMPPYLGVNFIIKFQ